MQNYALLLEHYQVHDLPRSSRSEESGMLDIAALCQLVSWTISLLNTQSPLSLRRCLAVFTKPGEKCLITGKRKGGGGETHSFQPPFNIT